MARILVLAGLASSLVNFRGPLLTALVDAGHEVHAIAPKADKATIDWLASRSISFSQVDLIRSSISPVSDLRALLELYKVITRIRPDAVIAYTIKPVVYGLLTSKLARVRRRYAMITGLGYAFTDGERSLTRKFVNSVASFLYRIALRGADVVLFQNEDDRHVFIKSGILHPNTSTYVTNGSGVDTDYFFPSPLPAAAKFLMVARLVSDKGVKEYLAAAKKVRSVDDTCEFHLLGPRDPGPTSISLQILQEAVAVGDVIYHGELVDVRPIVQQSSIFVLPSYREGTPRAVLEAMSMGRPIITTDAPGCRDTVQHGRNGLLVPIREVDALADAMMILANDPGLRHRMGQESRSIVVARYQAKDVAQSILVACNLRDDHATSTD